MRNFGRGSLAALAVSALVLAGTVTVERPKTHHGRKLTAFEIKGAMASVTARYILHL